MDNISSMMSPASNTDYLNQLKYQDPSQKIKTQKEVDFVNKALLKDGKKDTKELGKDEFLKLLITELQNQDPTNPMQDREFIAQMAQFSSLEQMLNFNNGMSKLLDKFSFQSSFNLLGMNVEIQDTSNVDPDGNIRKVTGSVQAVTKNGNDVFVRVDGEDFPVSNVTQVSH